MVVTQQAVRLPVPLTFAQTQVPVAEMQRPIGCIDNHKLRAARLPPAHSQTNVMLRGKRPARENQIPVAADLVTDVDLKIARARFESLSQHVRLIVIVGAPRFPSDFLQTDQVRLLLFNNLRDAVEVVPPVADANGFVNVISEKSHRCFAEKGVLPAMVSLPINYTRRIRLGRTKKTTEH